MKIKTIQPQIIELKVFSDDRGCFTPIMDAIHQLGSKVGSIKRFYYVYNFSQGVIRGFHFHKREWKFFTVVSGAGKFVIINPKKPSEIHTFISSSRKPTLIIVPPGYANGWMSLENETILFCASTSTTQESIKDDKRFDPYKWGDVWSVKGR